MASASRSMPEAVNHVNALRALKKVFDDFDLDGNGTVDCHEFLSAVHASAPHLKGNRHLSSAFSKMDKNKDSQLTFPELVMNLYPRTSKEMLKKYLDATVGKGDKNKVKIQAKNDKERLEDLKELFVIYDKDHNGVLNVSEFKAAMHSAFSTSEIDDIFQKVDSNRDQVISFEEFRDWMKEGERPASDSKAAGVGADYVDSSQMGSASAELAKRMAIDFKLSMGLPESPVTSRSSGASRSLGIGGGSRPGGPRIESSRR